MPEDGTFDDANKGETDLQILYLSEAVHARL